MTTSDITMADQEIERLSLRSSAALLRGRIAEAELLERRADHVHDAVLTALTGSRQ